MSLSFLSSTYGDKTERFTDFGISFRDQILGDASMFFFSLVWVDWT